MNTQYEIALKKLMAEYNLKENEIEVRTGNSGKVFLYNGNEDKECGIYEDSLTFLSKEELHRELVLTKENYDDRLYLDEHMNVVKLFYEENELNFEQFEEDFENGIIYLDKDHENPLLCMITDDESILLDLKTLSYK